MYQALYRKWRPRAFEDVVGQEHVTKTLRRQIMSGRLSHAYLFTGTRGTGKTTCAKLLARAVNCQNPQNGSPCNQCSACAGIENGSILDVMELDAASNNKVDDIRAILDEAVYTPASVKKRVYIVDEVHMLSAQAFNALLQILEEPPEHLLFILATTEIHKVPATIKSRCQQFSFKRIKAEDIAGRLLYVAGQEQISLSENGAALIARLADGGMRDALSLLDQCAAGGGGVNEAKVYDILGLAGNLETAALLENIAEGDTESALNRVEKLYAGGKEMSALMGEMSSLTRDLLVRKTAPKSGAALMTGGFDEVTLQNLEGRFSVPKLVQMLNLIQKTASDLARSANRRTDVELCLTILCDPTLDQTLTGLNARLARLEEGAPPAAPRREAPKPEASQPPVTPQVKDRPPQGALEPPEAGEMSDPSAPWGMFPGGWPALCAVLKKEVGPADSAVLDMVNSGSLEGDRLTLWTENAFAKNQLEGKSLSEMVARCASRLAGRTLRARINLGSAPAAQAGEEPDVLDQLIGLDNVTVE